MSEVDDFARDCGARVVEPPRPCQPLCAHACASAYWLSPKAVDLRTLWGYDEATAHKWLCPCPGPQATLPLRGPLPGLAAFASARHFRAPMSGVSASNDRARPLTAQQGAGFALGMSWPP